MFVCLFCSICVSFSALRHLSSLTNPAAHPNLRHLFAATTTAPPRIVPEFKLAYSVTCFPYFCPPHIALFWFNKQLLSPLCVVFKPASISKKETKNYFSVFISVSIIFSLFMWRQYRIFGSVMDCTTFLVRKQNAWNPLRKVCLDIIMNTEIVSF